MLPTAAQPGQKCIAADGHVTRTSEACGPGERLAGSYEAVPEPVTAGANVVSAAPGAQRAPRQASRNSVGTRGKAPGRAAADRCQAARDRRERTLARVGLKRTFDLLRKLDDEVWAACR